jgi:hypothetical protein
MNWLDRNSSALQAIAAIVTAIVAMVALIGIKFQVDASYRVQREQSAKEIYRELLNISIANPDFAAPNFCVLKQSPKFLAYESYVDYVLYTAEQVIDMDGSWSSTIESHLEVHANYICSSDATEENSPAVEALLESFRAVPAKRCRSARSKLVVKHLALFMNFIMVNMLKSACMSAWGQSRQLRRV